MSRDGFRQDRAVKVPVSPFTTGLWNKEACMASGIVENRFFSTGLML
jgi:hypothetical protein